jgi:outer membrane immunogenic protein
MKKFLLGSVALAALGFGAPAIAADMAVRPAPVPVFSWTGCHIGGLVGYGWSRSSNGYTTTGASTTISATPVPVFAGQPVYDSFDLSGFNGGGDAGCDFQFGPFVVGVEGDWSNVNKSGQGATTPNTLRPGILSPGGGTTIFGNRTWTAEAQERWYATARGRVGYALDRWLFFVSGGGAWTKVDQSQFIPGSPANFALDSNRLKGWTVGAGVDYAPLVLGGNWTIRAEYLYVHFRDYTAFTAPIFGPSLVTAPIFGPSLGGFSNLSTSLDNHIVRFGLAYKFNPFAYAVYR